MIGTSVIKELIRKLREIRLVVLVVCVLLSNFTEIGGTAEFLMLRGTSITQEIFFLKIWLGFRYQPKSVQKQKTVHNTSRTDINVETIWINKKNNRGKLGNIILSYEGTEFFQNFKIFPH